MTVSERLREINARVEVATTTAGRVPGSVRLVAVSKRQPEARVVEAFDAGHRDFGENYMQALLQRQVLLPKARWHMIGHLQTNKAKFAKDVHLIHTLDSIKLARALRKNQVGAGVLIEVNIAEEESKAGVMPKDAGPLLDELLELAELQVPAEVRVLAEVPVIGLMCIPPLGQGRRYFAQLRTLRDTLSKRSGLSLSELSMGMSGDFEDAILEGATIVRVGTAIFGEREGP